jgi:hypothetical protein
VARSVCSVSFKDERGIRHTVEVEAESLFEAAILAVRAFRKAEWIQNVGPAMPLDVEVRAPVTKHTITLFKSALAGRIGEQPKRDGEEGEAEGSARGPLNHSR